jgi:hypothetical protein
MYRPAAGRSVSGAAPGAGEADVSCGKFQWSMSPPWRFMRSGGNSLLSYSACRTGCRRTGFEICLVTTRRIGNSCCARKGPERLPEPRGMARDANPRGAGPRNALIRRCQRIEIGSIRGRDASTSGGAGRSEDAGIGSTRFYSGSDQERNDLNIYAAEKGRFFDLIVAFSGSKSAV